ncbi:MULTISPECIES: YraN family protein [Limnospira]|uniref:UPF0102 protein ARTHRO_30806 n=1 Tax=Limnospira indica PCC 8005 TaxID=376219 RepID=A0A9P1KHF2_9CYAN|nr:YraN family protein [Limnospira indica]CDM95537.1 conserved hypothetical protein [Limnospira indica PCC 8005]
MVIVAIIAQPIPKIKAIAAIRERIVLLIILGNEKPIPFDLSIQKSIIEFTVMSRHIGTLGEQLVAQWLQQTGWRISYHQYHCRWGEIDLIGHRETTIIFVEVKTRSRGNWDANGALAITVTKQAKLIRTAEHFLSTHPHFSNHPCRFDVALVRCQHQNPAAKNPIKPSSQIVTPGKPIDIEAYQLTLEDYIESAFP